MVTLLVSGSGTDVGKTYVTAALARLAVGRGQRVQIIKPVQTGVDSGQPSDADLAATLAGLAPEHAHTFRRFPAPLAPLAAAAAAGQNLIMKEVLADLQKLPPTDLRLIEGAGGVAVPLLKNGEDWLDFAALFDVNAVILVVPDQLGAINQARLVYDYYRHKDIKNFLASWTGASRSNLNFLQKLSPNLMEKAPAGIILNSIMTPPLEVTTSTREALQNCHIPLWGELAADTMALRLHPPLAKLLGWN